jgi:hypothetical protein
MSSICAVIFSPGDGFERFGVAMMTADWGRLPARLRARWSSREGVGDAIVDALDLGRSGSEPGSSPNRMVSTTVVGFSVYLGFESLRLRSCAAA